MLITKPVTARGGELELNVDASRGLLRVGIAAADPVPTFDGSTPSTAAHVLEQHLLPGFTFEDCLPVAADSVRHTVRFKGKDSPASFRRNAKLEGSGPSRPKTFNKQTSVNILF